MTNEKSPQETLFDRDFMDRFGGALANVLAEEADGREVRYVLVLAQEGSIQGQTVANVHPLLAGVMLAEATASMAHKVLGMVGEAPPAEVQAEPERVQ